MKVALVVGVVACASRPIPDTREVGRHVLLDSSGNAAAIEKLLHGSVVNGGLWFANPACAESFSKPGEIGAAQRPAFARCLAELRLQRSAREDALGDVVVMTYAPGFEVEARVVAEGDQSRLRWIGFAARRNPEDNLATITPGALESLRLTGDRHGPLDPGVAGGFEIDPTQKYPAEVTWIKLCIDEDGGVTDAHPLETTSVKAMRAFVAAARTWTFRPFLIQDRAQPVCSVVRMAYPADQAAPIETIPLPPPPSRANREPLVLSELAGEKLLHGKRFAGDTHVVPDDATKGEIFDRRIRHISGSFRICLDEAGRVESVLPMRSTGFTSYDRDVLAAMRKWQYSPYQVDGKPVPVCTAVTFIYSQR